MDNKLNLPADFETYDEFRKNGFLRMKELKESGKKVVGQFCSFVPVEIIMAAGLIHVDLCASSDDRIPAAEAHLPKNLCPLIKGSYGFALTDTCPYFYFADLIVGETTCDGKTKMFELMNELKPTYVMQLPRSRDKAALEFWRGQIITFKEKLEEFFNITITEDAIRDAIRLKNRERRVMREYLELGKLDPAPMSGYELGTRFDGSNFSFDMEERCRIIEERTASAKADWEANLKGKRSDKPRILVTGCPNGGVRDKTIKAVEEMGASIVAFDTCGGLRDKSVLVDENNPDIYEALATKYLNISCSVMSPNNSRLEYMSKMIDEFHVDGVIEIVLQSCHTYAVEAHFVRRMVKQEKGIPYLNIETDYSQADTGQINTRLAAFLETIEK